MAEDVGVLDLILILGLIVGIDALHDNPVSGMESCRIGIPVCREWAGNLPCLILEGETVIACAHCDVTYHAAEPV